MPKPLQIRRLMPSLAPVPAPLARIAEEHRRLNRAADTLGLDIRDPANHAAIAREVGWDWPLEGSVR